MTFVVAQCFGGGNDFSHICLSAIVGIEIEECVEVLDLFEIEGWILCDDRFCEDDGFFFLN
jgi:hypothetical protein